MFHVPDGVPKPASFKNDLQPETRVRKMRAERSRRDPQGEPQVADGFCLPRVYCNFVPRILQRIDL
jgi:hypothetical protein